MKTRYLWNNYVSSLFSIDIGVGQDSAFSLIISTLYISLIFHIFENKTKNLNIPILFLSFIDKGLFILKEKSFKKQILFFSVAIILFLLFLNSLSNTENLRSFIFQDCTETPTLLCYELKLLEWSSRTTLVLSNTRELDRELFYKLVFLI